MEETIFKNIYVQSGFSGVISMLQNFPKHLHNEMLEDLSMNIIEWQFKLSEKEKIKLSNDVKTQSDIISNKDKMILENHKLVLNSLTKNIERLELSRENIITKIEEYPSILPEMDTESISDIDMDIESIIDTKKEIQKKIDELLKKESEKEERMKDELF